MLLRPDEEVRAHFKKRESFYCPACMDYWFKSERQLRKHMLSCDRCDDSDEEHEERIEQMHIVADWITVAYETGAHRTLFGNANNDFQKLIDLIDGYNPLLDRAEKVCAMDAFIRTFYSMDAAEKTKLTEVVSGTLRLALPFVI
jgi:Zinc-finger double-stranded RNA-binding